MQVLFCVVMARYLQSVQPLLTEEEFKSTQQVRLPLSLMSNKQCSCLSAGSEGICGARRQETPVVPKVPVREGGGREVCGGRVGGCVEGGEVGVWREGIKSDLFSWHELCKLLTCHS